MLTANEQQIISVIENRIQSTYDFEIIAKTLISDLGYIKSNPQLLAYYNHLENTKNQIFLAYMNVYMKQETYDSFLIDLGHNFIHFFNISEDFGDENYKLRIINSKTSTKVYDYANLVISKFPELYEDVKGIALDLTEDQKHKVKCLYNKNKAEFTIITNNPTIKMLDYITNNLDVIFNFSEKLNDAEKALLEASKQNNKEEVEKQIRILLKDKVDLLKIKQTADLKNLLKNRFNDQEKQLEQKIERANHSIESYNENIIDILKDVREYNLELLGLKTEIDKSDLDKETEAIINTLTKSPLIKNFKINSNNIYINIITPVLYYDIEPLQRQINSPKWLNESTERKQAANILKEVFINGKYEMLTETLVSFDMKYLNYHADTTRSFYEYEACPHPHLTTFNCFGTNGTLIARFLQSSKIVEAINQVIGACCNFNFTDAAVLSRFCRNLIQTDLKDLKTFKDKETGELVSAVDIIKKLNETSTEQIVLESTPINVTTPIYPDLNIMNEDEDEDEDEDGEDNEEEEYQYDPQEDNR